ncbi:MAG: class I adenylate-forming enzyme family protein [Acidimicrobiales bacterium]
MPANDPTISWVLDRAAVSSRDREATVDLHTGERRTWGETRERVEGVASALVNMDLESGDRVGVLMLNSARHFELWFAIAAAGMVMNDLNYRLAVEELRFICDDSGVRVLFVDENYLAVARELRRRCRASRRSSGWAPVPMCPTISWSMTPWPRPSWLRCPPSIPKTSPPSSTPAAPPGSPRGPC